MAIFVFQSQIYQLGKLLKFIPDSEVLLCPPDNRDTLLHIHRSDDTPPQPSPYVVTSIGPMSGYCRTTR